MPVELKVQKTYDATTDRWNLRADVHAWFREKGKPPAHGEKVEISLDGGRPVAKIVNERGNATHEFMNVLAGNHTLRAQVVGNHEVYDEEEVRLEREPIRLTLDEIQARKDGGAWEAPTVAHVARAGRPVRDTEVIFRLDGKEIARETSDDNGRASHNVTLPGPGKYVIEVQLSNSTERQRREVRVAKNEQAIHVSEPAITRKGKGFEVTAFAEAKRDGDPLPNEDVQFYLDGIDYGPAKTDGQGRAIKVLPVLPLTSGAHRMEAVICGTSEKDTRNFTISEEPEPDLQLELTEPVQTAKGAKVEAVAIATRNGKPVQGVKIQFALNFAPCGTPLLTDVDGRALKTFDKLAAGVQTFEAIVGGKTTRRTLKVEGERKTSTTEELREPAIVVTPISDTKFVLAIQALTKINRPAPNTTVRVMNPEEASGFKDLNTDEHGSTKYEVNLGTNECIYVRCQILGTDKISTAVLYRSA